MLTVKEIKKDFGKFRALDDISVDFDAGDSIALLGPNGSGKTTLIKSILGLVVPTKGEIRLHGELVKPNYLKSITGYMPQIGKYPENLSIDGLIKMMLSIRGKSFHECDTTLYEQFQLEDIKHKKLGALSGGTKQKVGAVLAFLFCPEILILDEPTAGLDPFSSTVLKDKIKDFAHKKKLVIITSHIISELDGMVSKVLYLIEGKLHFYQPVTAIKETTQHSILEKALASVMLNDQKLRWSYANR